MHQQILLPLLTKYIQNITTSPTLLLLLWFMSQSALPHITQRASQLVPAYSYLIRSLSYSSAPNLQGLSSPAKALQ